MKRLKVSKIIILVVISALISMNSAQADNEAIRSYCQDLVNQYWRSKLDDKEKIRSKLNCLSKKWENRDFDCELDQNGKALLDGQPINWFDQMVKSLQDLNQKVSMAPASPECTKPAGSRKDEESHRVPQTLVTLLAGDLFDYTHKLEESNPGDLAFEMPHAHGLGYGHALIKDNHGQILESGTAKGTIRDDAVSLKNMNLLVYRLRDADVASNMLKAANLKVGESYSMMHAISSAVCRGNALNPEETKKAYIKHLLLMSLPDSKSYRTYYGTQSDICSSFAAKSLVTGALQTVLDRTEAENNGKKAFLDIVRDLGREASPKGIEAKVHQLLADENFRDLAEFGSKNRAASPIYSTDLTLLTPTDLLPALSKFNPHPCPPISHPPIQERKMLRQYTSSKNVSSLGSSRLKSESVSLSRSSSVSLSSLDSIHHLEGNRSNLSPKLFADMQVILSSPPHIIDDIGTQATCCKTPVSLNWEASHSSEFKTLGKLYHFTPFDFKAKEMNFDEDRTSVDPYSTGEFVSANDSLYSNKDRNEYHYRGNGSDISKALSVQTPQGYKTLGLTERAEVLLSYAETGKSLDYLAKGGGSEVYILRSNSGAEVLKFRKPTHDSVQRELRSVALERLLKEYTSRYQVQIGGMGEPKTLLKVAQCKSTPEEHQKSICRQDFIDGPSALEIKKWITEAEGEGNRAESAKKELLSLKFKDVEDAKNHILALENFYRKTHSAVIQFSKQNRLPIYGNQSFFVDEKGETIGDMSKVGFDYLHGTNVKFKDGHFHIFDW